MVATLGQLNSGNRHVLPDSRLKDRSFGTVMANFLGWRVEMEPIFCPCGKPYGYVPKDNTSFVCWLCRECYEKFGAIANTYAVPEDEFNNAVAFEMMAKHGKFLS